MAQQNRRGPRRVVTFRLSPARHALLAEVAAARGVDVTAVLNQLVAGSEAAFALELAERRRAAPAGRAATAALAALEAALPPADYAAVADAARSLRATPGLTARQRARLVKAAHPDAAMPPERAVKVAAVALGLEGVEPS